MGLSISPQVWITYIENLLEGIPNRQSYIAIMDDLMLHGLICDPFLTIINSPHLTWPKTLPKKMPAFYETSCISRKCLSHRKWNNHYYPHEK